MRNGAAVARIVAINTVYEYTRVLIIKVVGGSLILRGLGLLALAALAGGFCVLQIRAFDLGELLGVSGLGLTFTSIALYMLGLIFPVLLLFQVAVSQSSIAVVRRNVAVFPISFAVVTAISYMPFVLPAIALFAGGLLTVMMVVGGVGGSLGMWGVPLLLGLAVSVTSAALVQVVSLGASRLVKSGLPASVRALCTGTLVLGWMLAGWRLYPEVPAENSLLQLLLLFHARGVLERAQEYGSTELWISGSVLIASILLWAITSRSMKSSHVSRSSSLSAGESRRRTLTRSGRPLTWHLMALSTRNSPIWLEFVLYAAFSVAVAFFAVMLNRRDMESDSVTAMFAAGFLINFACMGVFGSVSPLTELERLGLRGRAWLVRICGIKVCWVLLGVIFPLITFIISGSVSWLELLAVYGFGSLSGFVSVSVLGFYLKDVISTSPGRMACSISLGAAGLVIALLGIHSDGLSVSFLVGSFLMALIFVLWFVITRRAYK